MMEIILPGAVFYGDVSDLAANDNAQVRTTCGREVHDPHHFIVFSVKDTASYLTPVYTNSGAQRILLDRRFATGGWMQHDSFFHPRQIWRILNNTLPYKFAEVGGYALHNPAEIIRLVQAINNFQEDVWRRWRNAA